MTDAEREYRAQWIRDAARDFLGASSASGFMVSRGAESEAAAHYTLLASQLWDLYVKERE